MKIIIEILIIAIISIAGFSLIFNLIGNNLYTYDSNKIIEKTTIYKLDNENLIKISSKLKDDGICKAKIIHNNINKTIEEKKLETTSLLQYKYCDIGYYEIEYTCCNIYNECDLTITSNFTNEAIVDCNQDIEPEIGQDCFDLKNNITINNGQRRKYYLVPYVFSTDENICDDAFSVYKTCNDGILTGDNRYQYKNCTSLEHQIDQTIDINDEIHLFMGDDNEKDIRYNLLIVSELSEDKTKEYLSFAFGNYEYSLFKTNVLKNNINKFNIYYTLIDEGVYPTNSYYCLIRDPISNQLRPQVRWNLGKERFDEKANLYPYVDSRMYLTKDPGIWPHNIGNIMAISIGCHDFSNPAMFATTTTHEFGHNFEQLFDEYESANNGPGDFARPDKNCCTIINCNIWDSISGVNRQPGCKNNQFFMGTDNSIMNSQIQEMDNWENGWGVVNEYFLEQKIRSIGE